MSKSYILATSFLSYDPVGESEVDPVDYGALNVGFVTRPRMLWRSTAAGHYIAADFTVGTQPAGVFVHNSNVRQWHVWHSDNLDPGTGQNCGELVSDLCPRTNRAHGFLPLSTSTGRRYLKLIPWQYHHTNTMVELGALACPASLIDLDDYVGGEIPWDIRQDINVQRFPGGAVQHDVRGPKYLGIGIRHDQFFTPTAGSSILSQLLAVAQAMPGPIMLYEAFRNDARYAYLGHVAGPLQFGERRMTFATTYDFEEYI